MHFGDVFPDYQIVAQLARQLSWSYFITLIELNKT